MTDPTIINDLVEAYRDATERYELALDLAFAAYLDRAAAVSLLASNDTYTATGERIGLSCAQVSALVGGSRRMRRGQLKTIGLSVQMTKGSDDG